MTLNDLRNAIENIPWFTRLGEFAGTPNMIPIRKIRAAEDFEVVVDFDHPDGCDLAVAWDWLPSQSDEADPIHGDKLKGLAKQLGKEEELRRVTLEIYKLTLHSLRNMYSNPLLKVGPHDFTEPAKGGALYAMRMAAAEIVLGEEGFWCSLVPLYARGFSPSGLSESGELIVF